MSQSDRKDHKENNVPNIAAATLTAIAKAKNKQSESHLIYEEIANFPMPEGVTFVNYQWQSFSGRWLVGCEQREVHHQGKLFVNTQGPKIIVIDREQKKVTFNDWLSHPAFAIPPFRGGVRDAIFKSEIWRASTSLCGLYISQWFKLKNNANNQYYTQAIAMIVFDPANPLGPMTILDYGSSVFEKLFFEEQSFKNKAKMIKSVISFPQNPNCFAVLSGGGSVRKEVWVVDVKENKMEKVIADAIWMNVTLTGNLIITKCNDLSAPRLTIKYESYAVDLSAFTITLKTTHTVHLPFVKLCRWIVCSPSPIDPTYFILSFGYQDQSTQSKLFHTIGSHVKDIYSFTEGNKFMGWLADGSILVEVKKDSFSYQRLYLEEANQAVIGPMFPEASKVSLRKNIRIDFFDRSLVVFDNYEGTQRCVSFQLKSVLNHQQTKIMPAQFLQGELFDLLRIVLPIITVRELIGLIVWYTQTHASVIPPRDTGIKISRSDMDVFVRRQIREEHTRLTTIIASGSTSDKREFMVVNSQKAALEWLVNFLSSNPNKDFSQCVRAVWVNHSLRDGLRALSERIPVLGEEISQIDQSRALTATAAVTAMGISDVKKVAIVFESSREDISQATRARFDVEYRKLKEILASYSQSYAVTKWASATYLESVKLKIAAIELLKSIVDHKTEKKSWDDCVKEVWKNEKLRGALEELGQQIPALGDAINKIKPMQNQNATAASVSTGRTKKIS